MLCHVADIFLSDFPDNKYIFKVLFYGKEKSMIVEVIDSLQFESHEPIHTFQQAPESLTLLLRLQSSEPSAGVRARWP